jgi:dihydrofolate synthase/folylpolyglutamate synthase
VSTDPEMAVAYRAAEAELLARWPETRIDPSLEPMRVLCDLLGDPQRSYPVIHLTGTNGKTSTSRMIDALLRALNMRTGRYTSPHLESMTERIALDGEPISEERFAATHQEILPYVELAERELGYRLSFFAVLTGMAFAAFADAPVDVAVIEVGLGGTWDYTNLADGQVAVITPISLDHTRMLGDSTSAIAGEKAGIIKPGAIAVLGQQPLDAATVLLRHAASVEATVAREGIEFGVLDRQLAVGGQQLVLRGLAGEYDEIFLPLHGVHQAHNAACALAAVEAFIGAGNGGAELPIDLVREAFAQVTSPARLEVMRRGPMVLIDAAHNPAGAAATAEAVTEEFAFDRLVGVVAVMKDKDVAGVLAELEPICAELVVTRNSTERSMPVAELAELAREIFGPDRVTSADRLDDAIDTAVALAEAVGADQQEHLGLGTAGVLITGSVITAGEARVLLRGRRGATPDAPGWSVGDQDGDGLNGAGLNGVEVDAHARTSIDVDVDHDDLTGG